MPQEPTVLASREAYRGKMFRVRVDTIAENARSRDVEIVAHGDSVAIVALHSARSVILVSQYRYPVKRRLWEIPAGTPEPGESAEEAARRELREETGYAARTWRHLFSAYTTPGFCDEALHVFHASDLVAGQPRPDEDETIEVREFSLEDALKQVDGEPGDIKTMLALRWLATFERRP